jgi:RiboL-PSP-HEPN
MSAFHIVDGMPSLSRSAFEENCGDVERLLDIHRELAGDGPGKKHGVEVLNKSAVVLMCAAWEAYCEDIAAEAIDHLVEHAADASKLPKELRKQIAVELEENLDDLAVWRLADASWRQLLRTRTQTITDKRNRKLNTPKTANIENLFRDAVGLPNVPSGWYWQKMSAKQAADKLDSYVALRGDIAHRAKAGATIKKSHASKFGEHVKRLVEKTDCYINQQLEKACGKSLF